MQADNAASASEPFAFEESLLAGTVAQDLRQAMRQDDVSQQELADRIGVSQPMISRTLARENMTLQTAARMACALGRRFELRLVRR